MADDATAVVETVPADLEGPSGTDPDGIIGTDVYAGSGLDDQNTDDGESKVQSESVAEPEPTTADLSAQAEPNYVTDLLREATDKGFTESDLKSFGNEETARSVLTAFDRRMAAFGDTSGPVAPYTPQPQPQIQPQLEPAAQGLQPFEIKLDSEVVDESVLNTLNGMNKHYADQATLMQQSMGGLIQQMQQQAFQMEVRDFDAYIGSLGDEFDELFGKGLTMDLDQNSANFKNRDMAFSNAMRTKAGYLQQGVRVSSSGDMFRRGVYSEFGDKIQTLARRSVKNRVETARSRQSHPPTRREGRPVKQGTDEAAYDVAAKMFREKGISDIPKEYE